ncbi:hypothetical protein LCGC14_0543790 [marine sediment metagenome]|uniref:Uncharacterized protein n=1 Tax=marine sediment metagenome TaxID=412755 RepID=A0A0F9RS75_9ZZZZ
MTALTLIIASNVPTLNRQAERLDAIEINVNIIKKGVKNEQGFRMGRRT